MFIPEGHPRAFTNFWNKVKKGGDNDCWRWTGTHAFGYGSFSLENNRIVRKSLAHRISWELTYGEIPEKMYVRHACNTIDCCNPSHLVLSSSMKRSDVSTRFWSKVDKRSDDECWEWKSAATDKGYGLFTLENKKQVYAHRLSYELTNGEIPEGMLIRHKCDNPPCCNPSHLIVGNHVDNSRDATERNRRQDQRLNPFKSQRISQKLEEIKRVYGIDEVVADRIWEESNKGTPVKKLASQWKISDRVITQIIRLKKGIAPRQISAY